MSDETPTKRAIIDHKELRVYQLAFGGVLDVLLAIGQTSSSRGIQLLPHTCATPPPNEQSDQYSPLSQTPGMKGITESTL
jgi:hypothetical protein